jgi:hypothetical protein
VVDDGPGLTGATAGPFPDTGLRFFLAVAQAGSIGSIAEASAELHADALAIPADQDDGGARSHSSCSGSRPTSSSTSGPAEPAVP